ncbi:MAG: phosphotransferase [Proteobacteria bacterium]|nr:phosphotransferase [Pseudomonadota bacterium]
MPSTKQPDIKQVEEALGVYYRKKHPARDTTVSDVELLQHGGMANLMFTYRIEYPSGGKTHRDELILRMSDDRALTQGDYEALNKRKEYKVLEKLQSTGIPVPTVYGMGKRMLGYSFIIMERVEGEVVPSALSATMTEAEFGTVWNQLACILADIHRLDWQQAGIGFLEPSGPFGFIDWMLSMLKRQFIAMGKYGSVNRLLSRLKIRDRDKDLQALDAVFGWLEDHKPATDNYVLTHGDYHGANALMHRSRITAIIDWERVAIGDAAFDVSEIQLLFRILAPYGWCSPRLEKCFLDDYRKASGGGLDNLDYYLAVKALLWITIFLPRPDIDPTWRLVVLGTCSEIIEEKTGIRLLESAGHFRRATIHYPAIQPGPEGDWALVEQHSRKAVEADPNLSVAYRLLAESYCQRLGGGLSVREAAPAAHEAIGKAVELAPESMENLLTLGDIHLDLDLDYAKADRTFRKVLERAPATDHGWAGLSLARIALREGGRSRALSLLAPLSSFDAGGGWAYFLGEYARLLFIAGDYEQSLKVYGERLNRLPDGRKKADNLRAQSASLVHLGRIEEARPWLKEAWDLDGRLDPEAYIWPFVGIGETERAKRILADSQSTNKPVPAEGYLALGDVDNTIEAIRIGIENRDGSMLDGLRTAELWDGIRNDPRFDDTLRLLDAEEVHTEGYLEDNHTKPSFKEAPRPVSIG